MRDREERGFAAMDPEEQRRIASMGGKAAHEQGVAHEFNHREAVRAGRKGGEAVSRDRQHMSEIGRKGGEAAGGRRGATAEQPERRSSSGSHDRGMADKKDEGYSEEAREFIHKEVKHHVEDKGMPQDQAVAAAMSEARKKGMKVPEEK